MPRSFFSSNLFNTFYLFYLYNVKKTFFRVTGWFDKSGFYWSRCLPSESPQNLLHSTWRWWTWHGTYWCQEAFGTLFAFTSSGIYSLRHAYYGYLSIPMKLDRSPIVTNADFLLFMLLGINWRYPSHWQITPSWYHFCCTLGLCTYLADIIHLHSHDGVKGTDWRFKDSYSECKLHGKTVGGTYLVFLGTMCLQSSQSSHLYLFLWLISCFQNYYPVLFRGVNGTVAHEFIVDLRGFKVVKVE